MAGRRRVSDLQHCEKLCPSKRKYLFRILCCCSLCASTSVKGNGADYFGCWHFSYLHCIPASVLKDAELLRGRTTCSSTNTTPPSLVTQAKVLWCSPSVLEHLFCTLCETTVPKIIIQRALSLGSRSRGHTCSVPLLCLPSANKEVVEKFSLSDVFLKVCFVSLSTIH